MKCPFCGAEMEQGVLQSHYGIYWLSKARRVGPPDLSGDAELLSRQDIRMVTPPYISASRCTMCRKIIVEY